jgi:hypothetical protein
MDLHKILEQVSNFEKEKEIHFYLQSYINKKTHSWLRYNNNNHDPLLSCVVRQNEHSKMINSER